MTRFVSLLIANRGEIVTRVARTAHRLGITTVAVASDADRDVPHTADCNRTVPIGGLRPADSYLRIDKLIAAAQTCGAQAVHPGYGFLSENAAFADAVVGAGLVWVGPPPEAMRAMGDKARARQRMAAAGVPVLLGYDGEDQHLDTLRHEAHKIGWPLMVKATAGGGGRGMRLVTRAEDLDAALTSAQAEAQSAFGEPRLLMERALIGPRHVEIQVFADGQGNVIHLGERDCSVQRRHQKIIEEAPSPAVSPALRRRMGDTAVTVAREIGYVGAGTVEFLLEASGAFWFMEMNTRLQVEHPLTEALVGVDLVEWQLRVAAGEPLALSQDEVLQRYERGGHAIEARLCAEDPARDFLPQAGTVRLWQAPPNVRCDHALRTGCEISPFYDSMLGKLIAHAPTRSAAITQLAHALDHTVCLGLQTNRGFLAKLLRHPAFSGDGVTTAFIGTHFADAGSRTDSTPGWLQALAAVASATLAAEPLPALWSGWTSSNVVATDALLDSGGSVQRWRIEGVPGDVVARQAHLPGEAQSTLSHRVQTLTQHTGHAITAVVDGRPVSATLHRDPQRWCWLCEGLELEVLDRRLSGAANKSEASAGALHAPMHGRITQVLFEAGATVQAGALLLVMEAMKMEHQIHAPHAGMVKALFAREGDQVSARQLLVELVAEVNTAVAP